MDDFEKVVWGRNGVVVNAWMDARLINIIRNSSGMVVL
jgi:hypothetical protein